MTRQDLVEALGTIGVLYGGWSNERQVSLWSGEAVLEALRTVGARVLAIDVRSPEDLFGLRGRGIDRVLNLLHGTGGEDGTVQAVLDLLRLPYPGCGVLASALAMDKLQTKRLWRAEGLPTADWRVIRRAADLTDAAAAFGYPFIVKPSADGSSVGITKVKGPEQHAQAWEAAATGAGVVLAERFVPGAEYSCAVFGDRGLPVVRIEPDGEFYDYHAKYVSDRTRYHCPAGLPPAVEQAAQTLCRQAFELVGGQDWGRVDFLMGDDGQPWLLEVNTLPGMTTHSLVPLAARVAGIEMGRLLVDLMATTLRHPPEDVE